MHILLTHIYRIHSFLSIHFVMYVFLMLSLMTIGCQSSTDLSSNNTSSNQSSLMTHSTTATHMDNITYPSMNSDILTQQQHAIVAGELETGFEAVGALLNYNASRNQVSDSFCTATLIDARWVLTAAHCLTDGQNVRASNSLLFYIGSNFQQSITQGNYPADTFNTVNRIIIHPDYDADLLLADIALIELDNDVTRTPLPIRKQSITFLQNETLTYIGFGASQVQPLAGSGVKRRTSLDLAYIVDQVYTTEEGSNVCFGDSGGPGLYPVANSWEIVGVNSAVADDFCNVFSIHTRVDRFAYWIDQTLNRPPTTCQQDQQVCACPNACQPQGLCDDEACATDSCETLYQCVGNCDEYYCAQDCRRSATATATMQLDAMYTCFEASCSQFDDPNDFQSCVLSECADETNACLSIFGSNSCRDMSQCINQCTTSECAQACYQAGDLTAQMQYDTLYECTSIYCGNVSGNAYARCVAEQCAAEYETCITPSACDLLGGDCPMGQACHPLVTGTGDCYDSESLDLGANCDISAVSFQCMDGSTCVQLAGESEGFCAQRCLEDTCGTDFECTDVNITEYRLCLPAEQTDTCVEESCDGIDNDCDDIIDENCMMGGNDMPMPAGTEGGNMMAGTDQQQAGDMAGDEMGGVDVAGTEAGEYAMAGTSHSQDTMMNTMEENGENEGEAGSTVLEIMSAGEVALVNETNNGSGASVADQGCKQMSYHSSQYHGPFAFTQSTGWWWFMMICVLKMSIRVLVSRKIA